jgi:hypothetical protein
LKPCPNLAQQNYPKLFHAAFGKISTFDFQAWQQCLEAEKRWKNGEFAEGGQKNGSRKEKWLKNRSRSLD